MDVGSAVGVKSEKNDGAFGGYRSPLFHNGPLNQGSHVGECEEHAGGSEKVNQFPLDHHLPQFLSCLILLAVSLETFPTDFLG